MHAPFKQPLLSSGQMKGTEDIRSPGTKILRWVWMTLLGCKVALSGQEPCFTIINTPYLTTGIGKILCNYKLEDHNNTFYRQQILWVLTMNRISRWESWITPFRRCQSEFISSINHMNSLHRLILKITCYIWWLKFPILGVSMELEDIIKHHLSGFVSLIMVSLTPHACHITYVHLMCTIHRWNGYTIRKNKIHIH